MTDRWHRHEIDVINALMVRIMKLSYSSSAPTASPLTSGPYLVELQGDWHFLVNMELLPFYSYMWVWRSQSLDFDLCHYLQGHGGALKVQVQEHQISITINSGGSIAPWHLRSSTWLTKRPPCWALRVWWNIMKLNPRMAVSCLRADTPAPFSFQSECHHSLITSNCFKYNCHLYHGISWFVVWLILETL